MNQTEAIQSERVKKTYRLSRDTISAIEKLCKEKNESATRVIEDAIQAYGAGTRQKPDESHTLDAAAYELLAEQLQVKDDQIAHLQKMLDQEQQLHAATKAEARPLLEEAGKKKRRWWQLFDKED